MQFGNLIEKIEKEKRDTKNYEANPSIFFGDGGIIRFFFGETDEGETQKQNNARARIKKRQSAVYAKDQ